MALFDINQNITLRLPPEFFTAVSTLVAAIHTNGRMTSMKLDEALEAIKAEGAKQTEAVNTLTTEVAKIPGAIDALEEQIRNAVAGELSPEAQAKVDEALNLFRGNTQVITDAAGTVKAGTDDAGDGTQT